MTDTPRANPGYKRIATEEAFATREMLDHYLKLVQDGIDDPGFQSLWGFYIQSDAARPRFIRDHLVDLGEKRLAHMDESGIDMAVLSLTAPGVQIMTRDNAVGFSVDANDQLAEACRKHPDRFVGLAAAAPQDPQHAAKEIERGVTKLGLKGVIINSHTNGEYLDDEKFWPIFEAAQALDVPIYIHPRGMSRDIIKPFVEAGLDGAIYGFGVETGLHLLRIITKGVFDRYPNLKIIVGHMGEALPFWMFRLEYMHEATVRSNRYESMKPLKRKMSDYLRDNVYITSSGVGWEPAVRFSQQVLGIDNVMYAMDYPYQYNIAEVMALDNMQIAPADLKKFYQTNAERVFRI